MVLITAACGSDDPNADIRPFGGSSSGAAVEFAAPTDGARVQSPFAVEMRASFFTVEPAGPVRPGAGHMHIMINTPCLPRGEIIPNDEQHRHFGDGSVATELDLPPGEHTLCLQPGDGVHGALALSDEITITVVE